MLEFDMPETTDKRYGRFKEALEASKIPFGKTFELDIEAGNIVGPAREKINFQNKQIFFGCAANPPQFSYWTINDDFQVLYSRNLHYAKDDFFNDGEPNISEISAALSTPKDYYERMRLEIFPPKRAKIKIFSDDEKWRFTFNGCENSRSRKDDEDVKYAVGILLDFYNPKNL